MKASITFREDQKPLFRAKVPLNILGFPFQSGIVAGDSKELSLNLGTFFESGPSLKVAYRPNDPLNPFSLILKSGIGNIGSAISSPMTMSAEFNPIGDRNPSFFIHFKPQFGDFSIKKSQSSLVHPKVITNPKSNGIFSAEDGSMEVVESPVANVEFPKAQFFPGKRISVPTSDSAAVSLIGSLLRGMEANAKTVFPVMNRAVVNFRWGFKFPAAEEATGGISIQKLPLLVMNKIGIEHLAENDPRDRKHKVGTGKSSDDEVAKACLSIKRQLEAMQADNGFLRKSVIDLKSEFNARKLEFPATRGGGEVEGGRKYTSGSSGNGGGSRVAEHRSNADKKSSEVNGGKVVGGDVNEELKKALMGA